MHENLGEEKVFQDNKSLMRFLRRLFRYSKKYPKMIVLISVATIVAAFANAIFPLIWLKYIDNAITPAVDMIKSNGFSHGIPVSVKNELFFYGGIYILASVIEAVSTSCFTYFAGKINENIVFDIRQDLVHKFQNLSPSFYDKSSIGWLVARITSDVDRLAELITIGFQNFVKGLTLVVFFQVILYLYSWKLALVITLAIPALLFFSINIRRKILEYSRISRRLNSILTGKLTENINGIELNKSTNQEMRAFNELSGLCGQIKEASYKSSLYNAFYMPVILVTGSVAIAIILFLGGNMALLPGGITIGMLAAFFGYSRSIFQPINELTRIHALAQYSLSAGERVFSLLDEKIDIKNPDNAKYVKEIKGNIKFDSVDFYYVKSNPVLQNFDLNIQEKESIALVGATGCGKSTIINLLSRFYEPVSGRILIDGADYKSFNIRSYRNKIGLIPQKAFVFSGTIKENIRYGNLNASDDEIRKALTIIGAYSMLQQIDNYTGEEGANLSEGEKQIISIARVILKDPHILLIDEATSYIDAINEVKIQNGIDYLMRSRTTIIIAHRLSTIKNCNRIIFLKNGNIMEQGSHEELINKNGSYANLYLKQFQII